MVYISCQNLNGIYVKNVKIIFSLYETFRNFTIFTIFNRPLIIYFIFKDEISQLEASNLQKNSLISDIQHELSSTKARLELLDSERRALEDATLSLTDKNSIMIKTLEKQVSDLHEELSRQKIMYEKRLEVLTVSGSQSKEAMKREFEMEREGLVSRYEERLTSGEVEFKV